MEEKAYFVKRPRRMDDLKTVHMLTAEEPYKIIRFVRQRGHTDGVLVVPATDGYVLYAAYRVPNKL